MKKRLAKKIYDYDHRRNFSYYECEEPYVRYSKAQVHAAYRRYFGSGLAGLRMPRTRIIEDNSLEDIEENEPPEFIKWWRDLEVKQDPEDPAKVNISFVWDGPLTTENKHLFDQQYQGAWVYPGPSCVCGHLLSMHTRGPEHRRRVGPCHEYREGIDCNCPMYQERKTDEPVHDSREAEEAG